MIVPVVPFALTTRSGVDAGLGECSGLRARSILTLTTRAVQYWVSVLIAVYGAALLAFSRE